MAKEYFGAFVLIFKRYVGFREGISFVWGGTGGAIVLGLVGLVGSWQWVGYGGFGVGWV